LAKSTLGRAVPADQQVAKFPLPPSLIDAVFA